MRTVRCWELMELRESDFLILLSRWRNGEKVEWVVRTVACRGVDSRGEMAVVLKSGEIDEWYYVPW